MSRDGVRPSPSGFFFIVNASWAGTSSSCVIFTSSATRGPCGAHALLRLLGSRGRCRPGRGRGYRVRVCGECNTGRSDDEGTRGAERRRLARRWRYAVTASERFTGTRSAVPESLIVGGGGGNHRRLRLTFRTKRAYQTTENRYKFNYSMLTNLYINEERY